MSEPKPRVLLVAEAANPEWTSVPLVGWSHARALGKLTDSVLVTQVRNREAFERAGLTAETDFVAIDSEAVGAPVHQLGAWLRRVTGLGWTVTTALATPPYYYFEHLVWRRFGRAIAAREFDIVHRLTPLSPTIPSTLARRCRKAGVPFVLGPLNGGVAWPREFSAVQRAEGEWLSHLRNAHKLLPGYESARRDAAALIAGSIATWEQLAGHHDRCVYIPENAIDPERFQRSCTPFTGSPLRVAFVGRLVPYKGADMLIEAAAELVRSGLVTLDVIGDGPEMGNLRALVSRLELGAGVRLDGWMSHDKLQGRLAEAAVFGFPSVREFGGGVVLEAMALGLVPIVVAYAGPDELVSDGIGLKVALGSRADVIAGVRRALETCLADPAAVRTMSDRAKERVRRWFTWDVKAAQVLEVYRWVLGQRARPDFGMPFGVGA